MDLSGTFATLLMAAREGEAWACTEIWLRYSPHVAGYLRARGSREVEDLTSEVFLAVFAGLARFEGDEPQFRSFLFTIAHRRLVDELRARARAGAVESWTEDTDPRLVASAEEEALVGRGTAELRKLINELAPDQRNVLLLRIFGDLTVDRVAEVLGKRPGAVKALQRRGLQAVRRRMGQGGAALLEPINEGRGRDGSPEVV